MKLIKTEDGTYTAFNEVLKEHYHSISGALEEAFEKHVKPLQIKNGMKILDFCFGLGYNSIAAVYEHKDLEITALENDLQILRLITEIEVPEKIRKIHETFSSLADKRKITDEEGNSINLILGDAAKTIKDLPSAYYHRVFFDPFSPGKQPELWSLEIFQELYRVLKRNGMLSTYSCAGWIRKNMKQAGFQVMDGPVVGRRSPGTLAFKK